MPATGFENTLPQKSGCRHTPQTARSLESFG